MCKPGITCDDFSIPFHMNCGIFPRNQRCLPGFWSALCQGWTVGMGFKVRKNGRLGLSQGVSWNHTGWEISEMWRKWGCRKGVEMFSGWWFGTWMDYDFPYIGNFIIPTDFHIFQRGRLNHQPVFVKLTFWHWEFRDMRRQSWLKHQRVNQPKLHGILPVVPTVAFYSDDDTSYPRYHGPGG